MSIEITGDEELGKALGGFVKGVSREVGKALKAGAFLVQGDAIKSIARGNPQGIVYKRKRPNGTHRASAEGQAPAQDTGFLSKHINIIQTENGVFVGTNVKYARFLELGTSSIEPRPFLMPALEKNRRHIGSLIKIAMSKQIGKSTK